MINKTLIPMAVKDLIPYENNPRINKDAVESVCESIRQCENIDPIEVDENCVILSGHTRRLAMLKLGIKQTDVIVVTGLNDDQKRKYRILANKTNEYAEWDFNKLDAELAELDFGDFDFGFDQIDDEGFGTDFQLNDGDKPEMCTMSFQLHEKQKELIEYALSQVCDNVKETFGNSNKNGNSLYEVVRQWAERRK